MKITAVCMLGGKLALRGRNAPKGATLQALARKGLVTLTKRSDGLFAKLTDAGWREVGVTPYSSSNE